MLSNYALTVFIISKLFRELTTRSAIAERGIIVFGKFLRHRFAVALSLAMFSTGQGFSAQITWSGAGGNANWSIGTNWAGIAPVNNDAIIFNGNNNLVTNNDILGLTLANGTTPASAIAFTNQTTVGAGSFTLNGNPIVLGGGIYQRPRLQAERFPTRSAWI